MKKVKIWKKAVREKGSNELGRDKKVPRDRENN